MQTGSTAIAACRAAHQRLLSTATSIDDKTARRPSRLPGWSVGHVLTHVARNADGHVLRLEGALQGKEAARYPGGSDQRNREIEEGAGRPAKELVLDLANSARRLEETWNRSEQAGWPSAHLLAEDRWPTSESPLRRLREVEVHHVDLGLGYQATDWPDDYVRWELPLALEKLPQRLSGPTDSRRLLAWLIGRSEWPEGLELGPW
ncbi:MAG: maleylpyruvate isomerase N-terminal domain-containing protein [Egibacteraceae bacterium]